MTSTKNLFPNGMLKHYPQDQLDKITIPPFAPINIDHLAKEHAEIVQHFNTDVTKSIEWRMDQLTQLKRLLIDNELLIVKACNLDFRKLNETQVELHCVLEELHLVMDNLSKWAKSKSCKPGWAFSGDKLEEIYEPLGTILNICPWNFPIKLAFGPTIGAIAAGNCVAIKPSELTPNASALIKDLVDRYMDPKAIKVFNGDATVAQELLKLKWDHIIFTGSPRIGKLVMRAASEHLTPVTLELGGKCPALVDLNTTDVNVVCDRIINAKQTNWGQVCISIDYVICLKQDVDKICNGLQDTIQRFFGKDYQSSEVWGQIVNQNHTQRLIDLLPNGSNPKDGKIVVGGRHDLEARFIEMTVVRDIDPFEGKLMQEEIFGPILPIVAFDNWDQIFNYIRSKEKPLASYLYSMDGNLIRQFNTKISSGGQVINDAGLHAINFDIPFGGVGNSGMGCLNGKHSFRTFSHVKGTLHRTYGGEGLNKLTYPPKDMGVMLPAAFPYMFRVIDDHSTGAQYINGPISFFRWIKFTLTKVICYFLGYE